MKGADVTGRQVRVNGEVVEGSIAVSQDGQTVFFIIHDDTGELPVEFRGAPPTMFGYSAEDRYQDVIVEGRLRPDGSLFLVYLSLYSLWRVGIGFLREGSPFLFGLHQAQVIGIIILAIAIPILALKTRWVREEVKITGK